MGLYLLYRGYAGNILPSCQEAIHLGARSQKPAVGWDILHSFHHRKSLSSLSTRVFRGSCKELMKVASL